MKTAIVAPPSATPVSLSEMKAQLRYTGTSEETYITALLTKATLHLEEVCSRKFYTQTWKLILDIWLEEIILPFGQVQSVVSIMYKNEAGDEVTFSSENYNVDQYSTPGRIVLAYGEEWPSETLFSLNPIEVVFVCGYVSVPDNLKHAVTLLAAHWFENREPVVVGNMSVSMLPEAIDALIWNYRMF